MNKRKINKWLKSKFKVMVDNILRRFGYYKCDYGFSCGRHWISIDDKIICQTSGDDVWMRDEDVHRLGYICFDHGKFWDKPD